MSEVFKAIGISLAVGFAATGISRKLDSPYLVTFVSQNLITILLALLAINGTTTGVVLTRMSEMVGSKPEIFRRTRKAMHESQVEQLVLIGLGSIVLVLRSSAVLAKEVPDLLFWLDGLLLAILYYAIIILYDTTKSVFVLLDHKEK